MRNRLRFFLYLFVVIIYFLLSVYYFFGIEKQNNSDIIFYFLVMNITYFFIYIGNSVLDKIINRRNIILRILLMIVSIIAIVDLSFTIEWDKEVILMIIIPISILISSLSGMFQKNND